jgi:FkbM family methyltransferase
MHILSILRPKPEYIFRPSQIVRRIVREYRPSVNEYEEVMLPWGLPLKIRPGESVGSEIWRLGVLELNVSEAIYRLLDPGEVAIDVGANIGHMTSIMALRVGPTGRVMSFEPHPLTFEELNANMRCWQRVADIENIRAHRMALSNSTGQGILDVPGEDSVNRGLASVSQSNRSPGSRFPVELGRLDVFLDETDPVGLLKADVEGHEYYVLKGAETALRRLGIRDIVFEDHRPYPTDTMALLQGYGYVIFAVGVNLLGLSVTAGNAHRAVKRGYIPTYLATSDPARALGRLRKPGWMSLRSFTPRRRPVVP